MRKRVYIKPIGIMVTEDVYTRVNQLCNIQELSMSEFIRDAIELKLNQEIKNDENNITNK